MVRTSRSAPRSHRRAEAAVLIALPSRDARSTSRSAPRSHRQRVLEPRMPDMPCLTVRQTNRGSRTFGQNPKNESIDLRGRMKRLSQSPCCKHHHCGSRPLLGGSIFSSCEHDNFFLRQRLLSWGLSLLQIDRFSTFPFKQGCTAVMATERFKHLSGGGEGRKLCWKFATLRENVGLYIYVECHADLITLRRGVRGERWFVSVCIKRP